MLILAGAQVPAGKQGICIAENGGYNWRPVDEAFVELKEGKLTQDINAGGSRVVNLAYPQAVKDAATKEYVDHVVREAAYASLPVAPAFPTDVLVESDRAAILVVFNAYKSAFEQRTEALEKMYAGLRADIFTEQSVTKTLENLRVELANKYKNMEDGVEKKLEEIQATVDSVYNYVQHVIIARGGAAAPRRRREVTADISEDFSLNVDSSEDSDDELPSYQINAAATPTPTPTATPTPTPDSVDGAGLSRGSNQASVTIVNVAASVARKRTHSSGDRHGDSGPSITVNQDQGVRGRPPRGIGSTGRTLGATGYVKRRVDHDNTTEGALMTIASTSPPTPTEEDDTEAPLPPHKMSTDALAFIAILSGIDKRIALIHKQVNDMKGTDEGKEEGAKRARQASTAGQPADGEDVTGPYQDGKGKGRGKGKGKGKGKVKGKGKGKSKPTETGKDRDDVDGEDQDDEGASDVDGDEDKDGDGNGDGEEVAEKESQPEGAASEQADEPEAMEVDGKIRGHGPKIQFDEYMPHGDAGKDNTIVVDSAPCATPPATTLVGQGTPGQPISGGAASVVTVTEDTICTT